MAFDIEEIKQLMDKWQGILRLRDWDIMLRVVDTEWRKTGDIKIDVCNRKAILMINGPNPRQLDAEKVVIHELLHLKLYGMDQMLEQLLVGVFGQDSTDPKYAFAYGQFMTMLESTVEDLTKGYLVANGSQTSLSYGRLQDAIDEELGEN